MDIKFSMYQLHSNFGLVSSGPSLGAIFTELSGIPQRGYDPTEHSVVLQKLGKKKPKVVILLLRTSQLLAERKAMKQGST